MYFQRKSVACTPHTMNVGLQPTLDLDARDRPTFTVRDIFYVTNWADRSGNGNDVSEATATNQPILYTAGNTSFNGIDNRLTRTNFVLPGGLPQPNTIFIVNRFDTHAANEYVLDGQFSTTRQSIGISTGGTRFTIYAGDTGAFTDLVVADETIYRWSTVFDGTSSLIRINGVDGNVGATNVGSDSMFGIKVGARYSNSSYFDGRLWKVLIYSGRLPDHRIKEVENYLLTNEWVY